jgi:hypothetical protein
LYLKKIDQWVPFLLSKFRLWPEAELVTLRFIAAYRSVALGLAGRAHVEQRELSCQRDDLAPIPQRGRFWSSQREQSFSVGGLPQVQMRAAEMFLNAPRIIYRFDAPVIGRQVESIL